MALTRCVAGLALLVAAAVSAQTRPPAKPATSLDVTVADASGKPVEGAYVMAVPAQGAYRPFGGGLASEKIRRAVTGRDGKARLEPVPPGPWNVTVHARGFVTRRLPRIASGPLAVRLSKGGSISGSVREGRGRRPVPGARVAVSGAVPLVGGWEEDATRNDTTTDAKGRFRLDGIGRTPVRIVARAAGFGSAEREARMGDELELFLFPGATLAGTVRDDEGRPVKGATVRAEGDRPGRVAPGERTDAQGEFLMPGIRPAAYTVVAREGGRAPGVAAVVVEPGAEARVSLVLSEGGFVTGRIVDPDGRPVAGRLRVEVVDGHRLPSSASDLMVATAPADGTFTLGPLPVGALELGVSAPRHAARSVDVTIARRGTADLGDVALETGLSIRGRVRDKDGNGIPGAALRARLRRPGERSIVEAASEPDGIYVVAGLQQGTYELTASLSGFATARATATAGGDPVDLVMENGGEIAGQVVDGAGQPAEDATVEAQRSDEGETAGFPGGWGSADEGDGRFVLRDLAAGRYVLQGRASGRGAASIAGIRVVAGQRTDAGTLRLGAGGIVRGTVVEADGEGVPGATVVAERDLSMQLGDLKDQTRSTGAFEIRGVPVGRVSVLATHPAFATPKPVIVEVDPEKEPTPVRIVLSEGARVEGRALHRDGRPLASGQVRIASLEPGEEGVWQEPSPVGHDGWFAVDHVGTGRARVELLAPSAPGALSGIASREVVLQEGEAAPVDFFLRDVVVAGVVSRGGQPAPGVRVRVRMEGAGGTLYGGSSTRALEAAPGPPILSATTREDGRYELLVFTPGRGRVDLDSAVGNQQYPGREVQVPDVERFELDLEIAESTVSGLVVDKASSDPVSNASVRLRRSSSTTGPDGSFSVAAEAGDQQLEVQAAGRKRAVVPLSVGPQGLAEVRVELERGAELKGRVVDGAGRPVSAVAVVVTDAVGTAWLGYVEALADGSFRFDGLGTGPHTVVAGGDLPGWAVRGGVTPGDEPVTLALRPGGRIAVRVLDAAGLPVEAHPEVRRVGGVPVAMPGGWGTADANGVVEVAAPAGVVEVEAVARAHTGRGTVSVRAGETVPLEIVVTAAAPSKEKNP